MPASPLLPGDPVSLGPWQLLGRLGQGGMGVVYQGVRYRFGIPEHAAVKVIWDAESAGPEAMGRFRSEVAAVMDLDDPGITRVLAADLASTPAWFATELVPGSSLQSEVTRTGPLARARWLTLAVLLLSTLDRIHAHGIIHRDLKPQNVLLGPAGPVIIDFGIATISGATGRTLTRASPRTELWAAPEQLMDTPASPATDVFALGLVLAWAASGRHPCAADAAWSSAARVHAVLDNEPDLSAIAAQDREWLRGMLRRSPEDRPDPTTTIEAITDTTAAQARALADEAYRQRWFGGARVWWQHAAELGDSRAMLELGDLSDEQGDADAARSWWARAAAAGEPAAADRLDMATDPLPALPAGRSNEAAPQAQPEAHQRHAHPSDVGGPLGPGGHPALKVRGRRVRISAALAATALVLVGAVVLAVAVARGDRDEPEASAARVATRPVPVAIAGDGAAQRASRLSMGATASCLTTEDGRASCWGSNAGGQLGSAGGDADAPRAVDAGGVLADATLVRIAVGAEHACALDDRGQAYCWGSNGSGQLGVGDAVARSEVPVAVDRSGVLSGKRLVLIGAAADTSCALDDAGALYCWGANDQGQMGNGTSTDTAWPIAVDTTGALRGRTIRRFSIGGEHACAIDDQGSAYCWGANDHGQLGIGTTGDSSIPVPVAGTDAIPQGGYESITAGGASTCGWTRDGLVACWGANDSGQLGIATTTDSYIPRRVDFDPPLTGSHPFGIRIGASTVCLAGSGEVTRCWGANASGQLGDSSTRDSGSPVQLTGTVAGQEPPPLVNADVGTRTSCGLSDDGRLWCWGSDEFGLLGDGPG
jgi:alpha-tubulin suppressor-like RCC1 family protein